ncbi:pyroglutamyl-peptidase I [Salipaludibacillus agaradhaerens]|uniref:pyroglutamyl-peptidase I n=1 Tax=Salipaludibacillus agaradhaerens TaxID=76935 RepID=UPI002151513A|nr:pyroglutamyl-peptidase I [Salipaludibacillus agaradhaerens]MCR6107399.1 pyroglutamyl-peptidase I [Salipaludibacillus agaradhaerens]MCR6119428.1 pyroglutamyl-peptidase I [Salipaludibacillus agaradhaerens]UJW58457.1 pyroglutamyl-peptidase I [Bacillus sp. A116_S68]
MRLLISGFEPFGSMTRNPTSDLVNWVSKRGFGQQVTLETLVLPVVYKECDVQLIKKVEDYRPDFVICLGVAVGRSAINLERIAINLQDSSGEGSIGDNSGDRPVDRVIVEGGPDGIFATLPLGHLYHALKKQSIPAYISNSAGTYICNTTLYSLLYHIKLKEMNTQAGFIHVPATPDMAVNNPALPTMAIETQQKALSVIINTLMNEYIFDDNDKVKGDCI